MMLLVSSLALLLAASDGAALAGDAVPPTDNDPLICQRVQEIGSLIRAHRVCMRKSEWQAQRRTDRQDIEKSQLQRATKTG